MSDMSQDLLRRLQADDLRLRQTETKEVPQFATGTFTPAYAGTGGGATWTYSVATGFYTRIGNRCLFNLSVSVSARAGVPIGGALITGLPFTSNATANSHSPIVLDTLDALTLSATCVQLVGRVPPGQSWIELLEVLGTAPSAAGVLAGTGLGTASFIRASGSYML